MSKSPLRKDKTCLNCNYVVENRFCPNCGQENTDTRKTFHHLFVHFFEDLTHYENAFWKTIKNLLLKPASLTKEYLSGKRLSYLAPVRLYIFISFVTFFLIAIFPTNPDNLVNSDQTTTVPIKDKNGVVRDSVITAKKVKLSDILKADEEAQKNNHLTNEQQNQGILNFGYKNVRELDSLQKYGPAEDKLTDFEYSIVKKSLMVLAKNTKQEMIEKFLEESQRNIPKVLFIYMPLFALLLWLFHGKKRWYYFDHGIFTLHYFSFLLLTILLIFFFNKIMNCFVENALTSFISGFGQAVAFIWLFYYFFPAHHRFYGETRVISFLKSIALLFINVILIIILLLVFIVYTFINIH
ncbi:DUF3667 domain-containing protein [Flavobacterium sangjuense]|uniref:DUF3667 domain-containing protein n=1 Tax=Flavobacterium sangjuense TaxID=2518177 RepID=A0A4P7PVJ7_9FLAO|nr:DUF3667 domain-containing protein [Flavobacterium sangjuense]QBZ99041.1 hypothetical protein GS03_02556 [Flavobacterium sangjuense]